MPEPSSKLKLKDKLLIVLVSCLIIGVITVICLLLFGHDDQLKSTPKEQACNDNPTGCISTTVVCTAKHLSSPGVFSSTNATDISYEARAVFDPTGKLRGLNYFYSGTYPNQSAAKSAEFNIHSNYNFKWQANYPEDPFSSHFSIIGNTVRATIYADAKNLDQVNANIILLEISTPAAELTSSDIIENYQSQGFTCSTTNI